MDSIKILKISEINQEKLVNFYEDTFQELVSHNSDYKWRYQIEKKEHEPLVAVKDSSIIGHVGCYPAKFKIKNKEFKGVWWSDVYIKKEFRGNGFAQLISKKLMEHCQLNTAICNQKSFKLLKKIGWVEAPAHYRLIKFVPFSNYLNFKNKKELKEIELNENNILKLIFLVEKINKSKKNCFVRDESWFEWRFIKYPKKNQLVFLQNEDNYIIGLKTKWKKFNVLKVLFTNNILDKNIRHMLAKWCKKNKFIFLSFIERCSLSREKLLLAKKLKFLSYSSIREVGSNFTEDFETVQFADSDIGF